MTQYQLQYAICSAEQNQLPIIYYIFMGIKNCTALLVKAVYLIDLLFIDCLWLNITDGASSTQAK